jgi:hypothetical protein
MLEQTSEHRQDDNIKMDLSKLWCEDVNKIELSQDRVQM